MKIEGQEIHTIWFDLDNTLIDRNMAMRSYLEQNWSNSNLLISKWLALDNYGYASREVVCASIATFCGLDWHTVWNHMRQNLGMYVVPDFAMLEMLIKLKNEVKILIVSNGSGLNQRNKIKSAKLLNVFDEAEIIISGEVGWEKPDIEIFQIALSRSSGTLDGVVMVGDNPVHDCVGADVFGIKNCWISMGRQYPAALTSPTWSIESLSTWLDDLMKVV